VASPSTPAGETIAVVRMTRLMGLMPGTGKMTTAGPLSDTGSITIMEMQMTVEQLAMIGFWRTPAQNWGQ
jgi:hypothetical protein